MKNKKLLNKIIIITFIVISLLIIISVPAFARELPPPPADSNSIEKPGELKILDSTLRVSIIMFSLFLVVYLTSAIIEKIRIKNNKEERKIRIIPIIFQIIWMISYFYLVPASMFGSPRLLLSYYLSFLIILSIIWLIPIIAKKSSLTHKISSALLLITFLATIIITLRA